MSRFTRRKRRPDAASLDRSLTGVRLLTGLVALVMSFWALQREVGPASLIGVVAGATIIASGLSERLLRRRCGVGVVSAAMTALDLVLVLAVLMLHGAEPGDPASLLIVLPLIEAGIRHGVFGAIVAWASVAMALFAQLAVTWTGAPDEVRAPTKFALILLVVALPAARLSQHLADRIAVAEAARRNAEHRADLLLTVFEGAAAMAVAENLDLALMIAARRLLDGRITIEPNQASSSGMAIDGAAAVTTTSAAEHRVVISLGTSQLVIVQDHAPDASSVDALELLCANARTLAAGSVDTTGESDAVLDRPGFERHLERILAGDGDVSLALVSLDNLKLLNDLYGRDAGDVLIAATVQRLVDLTDGLTSAHDAVVGRLGGNDFAVTWIDGDDVAFPVGATVTGALEGAVDLGPFGTTTIHAGVGAAVSTSAAELGETGPQLMRLATEAMFADRRQQNQAFLADADHQMSGAMT